MAKVLANRDFDLLVVDDDSDLRELLIDYFKQNGLSVMGAAHGREYKKIFRDQTFRLIILDIEMPGETGIELLQWTKRQDLSPPVLMLSAKSTLGIKVQGLEFGAEDYIVKPFEPRELLARVEVILRREKHSSRDEIGFGEFCFRFADKRLTYQNKPIALTSGEEELLAIFCQQPNKILTRDYITQQIKGYQHDPFDRTIDIRMTRLRKKLELDPNAPSPLKTIRAKGYQLIVGNG